LLILRTYVVRDSELLSQVKNKLELDGSLIDAIFLLVHEYSVAYEDKGDDGLPNQGYCRMLFVVASGINEQQEIKRREKY
jgi:hypothetical protein